MFRASITSEFDMDGFKRQIKEELVEITKEKFREVVQGESSDAEMSSEFVGVLEEACKDDPVELKRFMDHIRGTHRDPETENELLGLIEGIDFQVNLSHERELDEIGRKLNFKRTN